MAVGLCLSHAFRSLKIIEMIILSRYLPCLSLCNVLLFALDWKDLESSYLLEPGFLSNIIIVIISSYL